MRRIGCAIAGLGFIGPHHADAIRRLRFALAGPPVRGHHRHHGERGTAGGGLGEAVAGFLSGVLPRPVRRVGLRDVFGESGMADELLDRYHLRGADILAELVELERC